MYALNPSLFCSKTKQNRFDSVQIDIFGGYKPLNIGNRLSRMAGSRRETPRVKMPPYENKLES